MSLEWMNEALCAEVGTDLFFPDIGGNSREAIAVCHNCRVRERCLEYALNLEASGVWSVIGVWGGMTPRQRRQYRKQQRMEGAA
jgi:WhiB family redox-sensing transcriptional regulator